MSSKKLSHHRLLLVANGFTNALSGYANVSNAAAASAANVRT